MTARSHSSGLDIAPERTWACATATTLFLSSQRKNDTAFVVGESGLSSARHAAGWVLTTEILEFVAPGGDAYLFL